jgi:hypothetical protein
MESYLFSLPPLYFFFRGIRWEGNGDNEMGIFDIAGNRYSGYPVSGSAGLVSEYRAHHSRYQGIKSETCP